MTMRSKTKLQSNDFKVDNIDEINEVKPAMNFTTSQASSDLQANPNLQAVRQKSTYQWNWLILPLYFS